VSIDENKFRQVITNLVTNAFKFTPAGGKVTVSVSYVKDHKQVRIEVMDTGAGIATVSKLVRHFDIVSDDKIVFMNYK